MSARAGVPRTRSSVTTAHRTPLSYGGQFSESSVLLRQVFPPSTVHVGVVAARSSTFTGSLKARGDRVLIGAALGPDPADVRRRSLAELVERVSAVRRGREWLHENPGDPTQYPVLDLAGASADRLPTAACVLQFPGGDAGTLANGIAAHRDWPSAVEHALYEAVERHQLMCSWYLRDWPVSELPAQLPEELQQAVDALGGVCRLFQVGGPPLNTVLAVLAQPDGTQLTCGSAAGPDRQRNCEKAVTEALMLRYSIRTSAAVADLHGATRAETPANSLEHVLQHYDHGAPVLQWYRSRAGAASSPAPTDPADPDPVQRWLSVQAALARDVYVADVADTTARHSGWHVARVLVPAAVAYGVGDLVGRQADSITRVLRELGSAAGEVNPLPHPFG